MEKEKTMVSILCSAYNHEKYIEETLESFVNQKTNFEFEVIINDDCSTDNTAKIIKEYQIKYPNIIKPIYQEENQYSKGKRMTIDILLPLAKGKYFALCEGDDYWVDENKLQKQVDFLEKNSDYSLCVNNAIKVKSNSKRIGEISPVKRDQELTCEDFIAGGGGFVATNSILAPIKYARKLPSYFNDFSIDYLWQIYLSSCGRTYCFNDIMSAYRVSVENSWTDRMQKNLNKVVELNKKIIKKLKQIDTELNNKYKDVIKNKIIEIEFENILINKEYEKLKMDTYRLYIKKLPLFSRIKVFLKVHFPNTFKILKMILKTNKYYKK